MKQIIEKKEFELAKLKHILEKFPNVQYLKPKHCDNCGEIIEEFEEFKYFSNNSYLKANSYEFFDFIDGGCCICDFGLFYAPMYTEVFEFNGIKEEIKVVCSNELKLVIDKKAIREYNGYSYQYNYTKPKVSDKEFKLIESKMYLNILKASKDSNIEIKRLPKKLKKLLPFA